MIDTPGIYSGLSMGEYLADPAPVPSLSSGCAYRVLTQSPYHAWAGHPRNPARIAGDESAAMDTGSIIHSLLLEQDESQIVSIDALDYRTKAAQQARDDARAAGKHPILAHKMTDIRCVVDAARQYLQASELSGILDAGEPEATLLFKTLGTWCRARPDWISGDKRVLLHVKTTGGSANPDAWIRSQLMNSGYDMAAAFYETGAYELGMDAQSVFFVIETAPPYGCSLVGLSPLARDIANSRVMRAIKTWRDCLDSGYWPAYPDRIAYADAPAWAIAQNEQEEYRGLVIDPVQQREGIQA
jgi:hypothetical protein